MIPEPDARAADARSTALDFSGADRGWIRRLRGKDLHNGALVALDYRTGDVLAYVGSAGYYRDDLAGGSSSRSTTPRARPPAGIGVQAHRVRDRVRREGADAGQPAAGHLHRLRRRLGAQRRGRARARAGPRPRRDPAVPQPAGHPRPAAGRQRARRRRRRAPGPPLPGRPRGVPAVRPRRGDRDGRDAPDRPRRRLRHPRQRRRPRARPDDPRDRGPGRHERLPGARAGRREAVSPPDRLPDVRHPRRQHRPAAEPLLGRDARAAQRAGRRAPAGRGQDRHRRQPPRLLDLWLPGAARTPEAPALAVGVWMGNSDHSAPRTRGPGDVAHGGRPGLARRSCATTPTASRSPTSSRRTASSQARSTAGPAESPGPGRAARSRVFIKGTRAGREDAVDRPGLLYTRVCGGWMVDPVKAELGPARWDDDVDAWLRPRPSRRRRAWASMGSRTAYFWDRSGWGGPLAGACFVPTRSDHGNGTDKGRGHGPSPGHGPPGGPPGHEPPAPPPEP